MEQSDRSVSLYNQLVEKAADDIQEKGVAEVELGEEELTSLMQAGIELLLQTDKAKAVGLKVEVPKSEITWREDGVSYAGQVGISLRAGKPFFFAVNCSFDNSSGPEPALRLSEQSGPIIRFENTEDALRASDLFALAGIDLRTLNKQAQKVLSNPSSFLFAAVKEILQPSDPTKPAPLGRDVQLNPESVRAIATSNKTVKMIVSRKGL